MAQYITRYLRLNNAANFKETFNTDTDNNLYVFVGKTYDWETGSAPTLQDSDKDTVHDIWKDIGYATRIVENDIEHVIPRYDWVSGQTYNYFVHDKATLYANTIPFYVRTSTDNVYKCIANNGQSTVEPIGISTEEFTTSDGYTWKFMYGYNSALKAKFETIDYIPVTIETNPVISQYDVQETAVVGDIKQIQISESGNNYITDTGNISAISTDRYYITLDGSASDSTSAYLNYSIFLSGGIGAGQIRKITEYNGTTRTLRLENPFTITPTLLSTYIISPTVEIKGNGTDAIARSVVDTNGTDIDSIIMISKGSEYTQATATVVGNTGENAILNPIISPSGGHGSNAIHELNGINIMIDKSIAFDEGNAGKTVDNDFRFYGLVKNPLLSSNGAIAQGDVYGQTINFSLVNVTNDGKFTKDEQIYFVNSDDITSNVVQFANTNASNTAGILSTTNANNGLFIVGASVKGSSSGTEAVISKIENGEFKLSRGDVLFIDNFDVGVDRNALQRENFKVTLKF
jgi:hypothetical protein